MTGGTTARGCKRAILLLGPEAREFLLCAALSEGGVHAVFVSSPYEAAAELLRRPSSLVMDLALLARRHVPLLDIARRRGATVIGVGAPPDAVNPYAHCQLRVLARQAGTRDVLRALAETGRQPVAAAVESEMGEPPREGLGTYEGSAEASADRAGHARRGVTLPAARSAAPAPGEDAPSRGAAGGGAAPADGANLLTVEELAALLGHEP